MSNKNKKKGKNAIVFLVFRLFASPLIVFTIHRLRAIAAQKTCPVYSDKNRSPVLVLSAFRTLRAVRKVSILRTLPPLLMESPDGICRQLPVRILARRAYTLPLRRWSKIRQGILLISPD